MSNEMRRDNPCIELDQVSHRFAERSVFQSISLSVASGQVGIVAGANGSGKSTLLRIVAGLLAPTQGTAAMHVAGSALDAIARRRSIGYVAPDLALYRELTGVENLTFFARARGLDPNHDLLRAALDTVGLLGRGRDLVGSYSSGMRQRLKYAFALLGDPPVLILDEPTANLDREGMALVERLIAAQRARRGGGLVLIGTNEPHEEAWGDVQVRLEPVTRPSER